MIFEHMDVELVSPQVMKEISDTMTPQGVLALVKMMKYSLEDLLEQENHYFWCLRIFRIRGISGRSFEQERVQDQWCYHES